MKNLWQWCKNKYGRIVTTLGAFFTSVSLFDVGPIKQPLADLVGEHRATQIVSALALLCIVLSFARHQQIANKHPAPVAVPAPTPEAMR